MARRAKKAGDVERVRHLLALEAAVVMKRLTERQDEMVRLFSRHRSRDPLLEASRSRFDAVQFSELAQLQPFEQRAVMAFAELLGELRWYLRYTEDMPVQVRVAVELFVRRLHASHRELAQVLGSPLADGEPVVDAAVVEEPVKVALARRRG